MRFFYNIFFICLTSTSLFSQDIKQDFVNTTSQYASINSCIIEMNIDAYGSDKELSYSVYGVYKKDGEKMFQEMNNNIFLVNTDLSVLVLKDESEIIYEIIDKDIKDNIKKFDVKTYADGVSEIISIYDSLQFLGINNGKKSYLIYTSNNSVKKTYVSFEIETKMVSEIIYYYNDRNMYDLSSLHLKFKNNINPQLKSSVFSEEQFMRKINGEYIGIGNFKTFKIINNNQI